MRLFLLALNQCNAIRILVWYVIGNWIAQWKNDIAIWENKVWTLKPLLVKEDGPVQKLRR